MKTGYFPGFIYGKIISRWCYLVSSIWKMLWAAQYVNTEILFRCMTMRFTYLIFKIISLSIEFSRNWVESSCNFPLFLILFLWNVFNKSCIPPQKTGRFLHNPNFLLTYGKSSLLIARATPPSVSNLLIDVFLTSDETFFWLNFTSFSYRYGMLKFFN